MFEYVNKKEVKAMINITREIIAKVQKDVKQYFTFEVKMIGSCGKGLITINSKNNTFDLDYNLILQKDKKHLFSQPKLIRDILIESFNKFNGDYGFEFLKNSRWAIPFNLKIYNQSYLSFDVAVITESNNGNFIKIIYDKTNDNYIWSEIKNSSNYSFKLMKIKEANHYEDFRKRYLKLKNNYLELNIKKESLSIFIETINSFY